MKSFNKNVYLIGYMGVGKSSIGKRLANRLKSPFFDLDTEIEKSQNKLVSEIFDQKGDEIFRELERQALLETSRKKGVISTGGGTPCYGHNLDFMLENGTVVWLKMPEEIIVSRVAPKKAVRPLIASIPDDDLLEFIQSHLKERKPYYEKAHIQFDATNINSERLEQLIDAIQSY